jgi:hypothetical protein
MRNMKNMKMVRKKSSERKESNVVSEITNNTGMEPFNKLNYCKIKELVFS